jgi:hypothetical protein
MYGSTSSSDTILKDATGVEPGCVEIIPRNLVTLHVRTWLYSLHTDTRNFSDKVTCNNSKCVIHTYPCWYTLLRQKYYWNENYQILMLLNIQSMVCRDGMSCNMVYRHEHSSFYPDDAGGLYKTLTSINQNTVWETQTGIWNSLTCSLWFWGTGSIAIYAPGSSFPGTRWLCWQSISNVLHTRSATIQVQGSLQHLP